MKIVVTDSNVFVLFHECGLLVTLLSSRMIEINIPEEVFLEITINTRRVAREYPDLPALVNQARHGNGQVNRMILVVSNVIPL